MKILIIEDEFEVVQFLKKGLLEEGYSVQVAYDGKTGERLALEGHFNLIILDIILPGMSGHEVCKHIREKGLQVPILMLTALGTTDDKIAGLNSGADDYLVKPFSFDELLARINAMLRRCSGFANATKIKIADLLLDSGKQIVSRNGININLTSKEFELLEYLIKNKGRILTRADIAEKLWDVSFDTGTNVIDVYISILRKKVDKNSNHKLIRTKFGSGYYIEG